MYSTRECRFYFPFSLLISALIAESYMGEPSVLCKLDLEQVYDHVNWDFLIYMLRRSDFRGEMVYLNSSLYIFLYR
jgi:hypothetical protein